MEPREQQLVIILADISGYTKFMVENQQAAVHGQLCITFLIETILREVNIPLQLQEIEGDAVFLYAAHPGNDAAWREVLAQVRTKLVRFFEVFLESMVAATEATRSSGIGLPAAQRCQSSTAAWSPRSWSARACGLCHRSRTSWLRRDCSIWWTSVADAYTCSRAGDAISSISCWRSCAAARWSPAPRRPHAWPLHDLAQPRRAQLHLLARHVCRQGAGRR